MFARAPDYWIDVFCFENRRQITNNASVNRVAKKVAETYFPEYPKLLIRLEYKRECLVRMFARLESAPGEEYEPIHGPHSVNFLFRIRNFSHKSDTNGYIVKEKTQVFLIKG